METLPLIGAYITGLFSMFGVIWTSARGAKTSRELENLKAALGEAATLRIEGEKARTAHAIEVDLANRKGRLERVNSQLRLLYGPLHALSSASNRTWEAFRSVHRPGGEFFRDGDPPTEADLKAWRLWMSTVFMPLNLEMERIVLSNMDLLTGNKMDPCLIELCAHVQAYKTVLARWSEKDFSFHHAPMNFPSEAVQEYAVANFAELKQEQQDLLALALNEAEDSGGYAVQRRQRAAAGLPR